MDKSDVKEVIQCLKDRQESEHDIRQQSREADDFLHNRRGQWETFWWNKNDGRPRYTFDHTSPVVDQIAGTLERSDFVVEVAPSGHGSNAEKAELYEGLIRNIENISGASGVYNRAGRKMVGTGVGGWRVLTKYATDYSFEQDLYIEQIHNYVDRVWHGPHEEPDASDAQYCFVLGAMTEEEINDRFSIDGEAVDVKTDREYNSWYHKDDLVAVGEFLYFEDQERELCQLSNGAVLFKDSDEYKALMGMAEGMITIKKSRKVPVRRVMSRLFHGNGWLTEPRETPFMNWIPVIPVYGNFTVSDEKRVWYGATEKMMDSQRVLNYALSRSIEEGALAPRAKWLVTEDQIDGLEEEWAELNISSSPYLVYNFAPGQQAPYQDGGAQVNPGLTQISEAMSNHINHVSGMFAANMGDNPNAQSGVAIEALQDRGDTGTNKYLEAMECAISHTGRILVQAIPKVYDPARQIRLVGSDGNVEFQQLGMDLSEGIYDVSCSAGPSYKNRQNETVSALTEIAKVDPTILQVGADILASNITSPGMSDIGERQRRGLLMSGMIPESQMTEEEIAEMQEAAQQPQEPSPEMVLAQAEQAKADADAAAVQQKAKESDEEHMRKMEELRVRDKEANIKLIELQITAAEAGVNMEKVTAETLKILSDTEAQDVEIDVMESRLRDLIQGADRVQAGQDTTDSQ